MGAWLTIIVDLLTDLPIIANVINQVLNKFKTTPAQIDSSIQATEQKEENAINQTGRPQ